MDFEGFTQNPIFKYKYQILGYNIYFDKEFQKKKIFILDNIISIYCIYIILIYIFNFILFLN